MKTCPAMVLAVVCLAACTLAPSNALAADKVMPQILVEQRTSEPLLILDRPYEDMGLGYVNVIRTDGV